MYLPAHRGKHLLFTVITICLLGWLATRYLSRPHPEGILTPIASLYESGGLTILSGKPFTGIAEEEYSSGRTKRRAAYVEGKLHGATEEWWENGQQKRLTHFLEGRRHGANTSWNSDGTLQKMETWENDKLISSKP